MMQGVAKPRGPRAVGRVLDLFDLLASHPEGQTLAQLSAALGVPKPTFLETLRGLCEQHFLIHQDGRYRLGSQTYRLASKLMSAWSAPRAIRYEVNRLAALTHESVGFAIPDWELGQVIYTEAVNSTQMVRYAMHPGIRAPLYASAAGRVLLAFSPQGMVEEYLARTTLRRFTETTRFTPESIRSGLAEIRARGYCASFGEMLPDTGAVAAPVFGIDGHVSGAMMIAGPLDRLRRDCDAFIAAILEASRNASGGYHPDAVRCSPSEAANPLEPAASFGGLSGNAV